ncbi:MucR family transcriptional regulator [Fretibacter rubidus]|uniref:MucR family transcriptional regulator n=1 Tax=Fretibacter rubidus TaxID=570162 RepID=UPI00352A3487
MDNDADDKDARLAHMVAITTAYVSHNKLNPNDVPGFMRSVFGTLSALSDGEGIVKTTQTPAVPIEQSLTDDAIICLEDGLPFKSLKRHLRSKYDMTPEAYRQKWGLPADYPMVAPNYAKARSKLARQSGLGRNKRD